MITFKYVKTVLISVTYIGIVYKIQSLKNPKYILILLLLNITISYCVRYFGMFI